MTFSRHLSLEKLKNAFKEKGVQRIYFKILSSNDNSKRQVYFGSDFSVLNIIPHGSVSYSPSEKNSIYKTPVNFYWISNDGIQIHKAPNAQLILYPQYPEVRFSGFLKNCLLAPSEIMSVGEQNRCLVLGTTRDGKILGYAVSAKSELANELITLNQSSEKVAAVFVEIESFSSTQIDNRIQLLSALKKVSSKGWIDSKRLDRDGKIIPCLSSNCGGYTLEAELNIRPNGYSKPDYLGWEVKQHNVKNLNAPETGVLTLMTPEPKEGFYSTSGVISFVTKYGYPDTSGKNDRWNFGGVHKFGEMHPRTKLTLALDGFDFSKSKIIDCNGGIVLYDQKGNAAAKWPFPELLSHWYRKHAKAVYVPSIIRKEPKWQYMYGNNIRLGVKTDFVLLLNAIAAKQVYYDPGIKVEEISTSSPKTKRRSQFRISSKFLKLLYLKFEDITL